jgi:hypothetical protein
MDAATLKTVLDDHAKFLAGNAAGRRANLRGANLRHADLQTAELRGADLLGADLRQADLRGADLRDADLWEANLRGADLRYAHLRGADLRGANLRGADLWKSDIQGVIVNWESHDLLSAILWRAAETQRQEMYAAYVWAKRAWCWEQWVAFEHPAKVWAIKTLAPYATDDNPPPAELHNYLMGV